MSLSLDRLKNLVLECREGMTSEQIRERVERMETQAFEVICDGHEFVILTGSCHICYKIYHIFEIDLKRYLNSYLRTYIFTQKRSNIVAQAKTYSGQKRRPLEKLHIHCSTRGYIVLMTGMWPASGVNDADILKAELSKSNDFR